MSISGVSSSLGSVHAAMNQQAAVAQSIAGAGLPGIADGGSNLVEAMVQGQQSAEQMSVALAALSANLKMQGSVIDILA